MFAPFYVSFPSLLLSQSQLRSSRLCGRCFVYLGRCRCASTVRSGCRVPEVASPSSRARPALLFPLSLTYPIRACSLPPSDALSSRRKRGSSVHCRNVRVRLLHRRLLLNVPTLRLLHLHRRLPRLTTGVPIPVLHAYTISRDRTGREPCAWTDSSSRRSRYGTGCSRTPARADASTSGAAPPSRAGTVRWSVVRSNRFTGHLCRRRVASGCQRRAGSSEHTSRPVPASGQTNGRVSRCTVGWSASRCGISVATESLEVRASVLARHLLTISQSGCTYSPARG